MGYNWVMWYDFDSQILFQNIILLIVKIKELNVLRILIVDTPI